MPNWKKVVVSGSDALLNTVTTTGDIIAGGNIYAEQYVVSSSVTHMTQSFSSGSTIFGDTLDDTHIFTGSLFITGLTYDDTPLGDGVVVYDTSTGQFYYTGSYGGGGASQGNFWSNIQIGQGVGTDTIDADAAGDTLTLTTGSNNIEITRLGVIGDFIDFDLSDNISVPTASIDDLTAVDLNLSGDGTPEIIADGTLTLSSSGAIIISGSSLEVNGPIVATSITASISSSNIQGTLFTFTDGTNQGDITFEGNTVTSGVAIVASASGLSTTDNVEFARISASGHLFASTSDAAGGAYFSVLVNTESGQFYYTSSATGQDTDWTIDDTDDYIFNTTAGDGSTREVVISSASATIPSARKLLNVITDNSSTDLTADIDSATESGMLLYNNNGEGGGYNDKYANIDFKAGNSEGRFAFQQTTGGQGNFSFITDNNGSKLEALRIKGGGDINVSGSVTASLPFAEKNMYITYDTASGGFSYAPAGGVRPFLFKYEESTDPDDLVSGFTPTEGTITVVDNVADGIIISTQSFNNINVHSSNIKFFNEKGSLITLISTASGNFKVYKSVGFSEFIPDGKIIHNIQLGAIIESAGDLVDGEIVEMVFDKSAGTGTIAESGLIVDEIPASHNTCDIYFTTESTIFSGVLEPMDTVDTLEDFKIAAALPTASRLSISHITSSGNISASGYLIASSVTSSGGGSFLEGGVTIDSGDSTEIYVDGNITASGDISASGLLFANAPEDTAGSYNNAVVYDTATGQFYYTGSYGSGGGTAVEGTNQSILFFNGDNNSSAANPDVYGDFDFQYNTNTNQFKLGASAAGAANALVLQSSTSDYSNSLTIGYGGRSFYFDTKISSSIGANPFGRFSGLARHLVLHSLYPGSNEATEAAYPAPSRLTVSEVDRKKAVATFINLGADPSRVLHLGAKVPADFNSPASQKFIDFTTETTANGDGTYAGAIEYNQGITGNSFVIYYGNFSNPSDKNLKKNIVDTKFGVNDLMKFKVKDFNWKESPKETPKTTGLIAQEVQEIFPNLVSKSEDTLHLKTNDIVPMLIKAVQDQQKEIEELKQLIKDKLS